MDMGDGNLPWLPSMSERSTDPWFGVHPDGPVLALQELGVLWLGNAEGWHVLLNFSSHI